MLALHRETQAFSLCLVRNSTEMKIDIEAKFKVTDGEIESGCVRECLNIDVKATSKVKANVDANTAVNVKVNSKVELLVKVDGEVTGS